MVKIAFMGAGSTVFAKNVIGDCMHVQRLKGSTIALYDIDSERLDDSKRMLQAINRTLGAGFRIRSYLGRENRRRALRGSDFVINAVQIGGYRPSTVIDFEIPKKYGLRQTIADTLGIGGIFRSLRTIPVVLSFADDMRRVCPDALFLNYVNPMAMITGAMLSAGGVKTIGLCHSVQGCAASLLRLHGIDTANTRWRIAGINHMAWLLDIEQQGQDMYPLVKQSYREAREIILAAGGARAYQKQIDAIKNPDDKTNRLGRIARDMVRHEIMLNFGHYVTESSEHNSEYTPYWIKARFPELIDRYNIPLDEYPRRCESQIDRWKKQRAELTGSSRLEHKRTREYASNIIDAVIGDTPFRVHGNVLNQGFLIDNLPEKACVEVPCMIDRNGVNPCRVGPLPEQCAALNRTNINVQLLTVEAALTRSREKVIQAALLDPHTASELTLDQIVSLCDDLIAAHGSMLPPLKD